MAWVQYGSFYLGEDNVYPSLSLMIGAGIAYIIESLLSITIGCILWLCIWEAFSYLNKQLKKLDN